MKYNHQHPGVSNLLNMHFLSQRISSDPEHGSFTLSPQISLWPMQVFKDGWLVWIYTVSIQHPSSLNTLVCPKFIQDVKRREDNVLGLAITVHSCDFKLQASGCWKREEVGPRGCLAFVHLSGVLFPEKELLYRVCPRWISLSCSQSCPAALTNKSVFVGW